MASLIHAFIFACSILIVWFFAGILVDSVNRIARRFHETGFMVSFFVLGFLTSLSEISVAINAGLQGVPNISVGNLLGASFVLLLFVVPLLAVAGGGIELRHSISKRNLVLSLGVILLPLILVLDGTVSKGDGLLSLLAFGWLLYSMYRQDQQSKVLKQESAVPQVVSPKESRMAAREILNIFIAAVAIFMASKLLVEQAVYFSTAFGVSQSIVGLMLLSVGTNVPELVVAIRSILKRHKDIAFGDYIGSAAVNTFIFGALASACGAFSFDPHTFTAVTILMVIGIVCFYRFARTKNRISRKEGAVLLMFYLCFIGFYVFNLASGAVR